MSEYILGSCLEFTDKSFKLIPHQYDYFFTSPPCYEDLASFGVSVNDPESYQIKFLQPLVAGINSRLGTATFAFTGDRRNNGRVLPKFHYLMNAFVNSGWYLRDVKYSKKSESYNAYSSNIIHVYTFQKEGTKAINNMQSQSLYQRYGLDFWGPFPKEKKIDGEVVGQPIDIAANCIEMFTNPGHVVYDPFAGIGTTLIAAKRLGRDYIGYEIRNEIWNYGKSHYDI